MQLEVQLHWNKCTAANMRFLTQHGIKDATERCYSHVQEDLRVMGIEKFEHRAQVIRDMDNNEVGFVTLRKDYDPASGRSKANTDESGGSGPAADPSGSSEPAESQPRETNFSADDEELGLDEYDLPA